MLASHEVYPNLPPKEEVRRIDLTSGLSIKERWDISGDTFPARIVNSICRLAYRRTRLDLDALACDEYYAERPRTVAERFQRIREALNPNLLMLQAGHFANDLESGVKDSIQQLRENPTPEE